MLVRFRIDGVLQEMMTVPKDRVLEVTSRIKIMSRLTIADYTLDAIGMEAEGAVIDKGVGCSSCGYTGYKGRESPGGGAIDLFVDFAIVAQ
jgi:type II secretory ATPase GspE/PulE/Tfp pilus assembly ATPase PilB-like protein